jgi:uncharacterized protein DUF4054
MNGTTPPVVFSFQTWVGLFPEFSALTPDQGAAYFMRATGSFAANSCSNPANADGRLSYLLYLATSHVAWLACPKDANGNPSATGTAASPLVGRISSAAEGSVNVQTELEMGTDLGAFQAYLSQTKYGLEYWLSVQNYRTARYLARPTIVVNGIYPGLWSPGRWG